MVQHSLTVAVKGPNPNDNPHLALAIERAKKASVPKALIESAIARGQGVSASGVKLESCTLEAILPPSVAVVIELETDNRLRTLAELRVIVKDHEGNVTPTGYMLERMGRVVLRDGDKALSADDVLEAALDAGAVDVAEGEEHTHVVLTEPASTSGVSEELAASLGAEVESVDIVWSPNEDTKTRLNSDEAAVDLMEFLTALQDVSEVQAVHTNIARGAVSDDVWAELQRRVRV
ncbi:MAG: YebC/PmpR family DNA-binding transcriptional regulator [Terriglobus roseus]|nr:YebC/PmpR family DNA-binding transcriptional regulator [Terriglobus roseus]